MSTGTYNYWAGQADATRQAVAALVKVGLVALPKPHGLTVETIKRRYAKAWRVVGNNIHDEPRA